MIPGEQLPDPYTAADNYRRVMELAAQARETLTRSTAIGRADINMAGVARRAGIHEKTLHLWVRKVAENEPAEV